MLERLRAQGDEVRALINQRRYRAAKQAIDALERGPGVVKVRKIRVATRNDDPNLVDVTLQVSTWQLKA